MAAHETLKVRHEMTSHLHIKNIDDIDITFVADDENVPDETLYLNEALDTGLERARVGLDNAPAIIGVPNSQDVILVDRNEPVGTSVQDVGRRTSNKHVSDNWSGLDGTD